MIEVFLFIIGIALLVKGADYLVESSSSLARKYGVSTLMIGLTIVAFGTSMSELIVNILSAIDGSTDIAFGNIIGSNIANILLILGITSLIYPLKIQHSTVWKEIPFAVLAVAVLFVVSNFLLIDKINLNSLTRVSGILMLFFLGIFIYYTMKMGKKNKSPLEDKKMKIPKYKNIKIVLLILGGLVGLYLGGTWTVEGAVFIAKQFGLSEFLISATVIAIGTSLPELATGIVAARKKDVDLAVGNVVGSNIFNIFWILAITVIIAPIAIPSFINVDVAIMGGATLLLFLALFVGKNMN